MYSQEYIAKIAKLTIAELEKKALEDKVRTMVSGFKFLDLIKKYIKIPTKEEAIKILVKAKKEDLKKAYKYLPTLKGEAKASFNFQSIKKYLVLLASIAVLSGGALPPSYADDMLDDLVGSVREETKSNVVLGSITFEMSGKVGGKSFKALIAVSSADVVKYNQKWKEKNKKMKDWGDKLMKDNGTNTVDKLGHFWVQSATLGSENWSKNECDSLASKLEIKYDWKKLLDDKSHLPNNFKPKYIGVHLRGKASVFASLEISGSEAEVMGYGLKSIGESSLPHLLEILKKKGIAKTIDD